MMLSRHAPPLTVLALLLSLAGCAAPPVGAGVYPLRPQQRVTLAPATTLTYDSFSDSRCPADARCIWAGRLIFRFVIDGPWGSESFSLGPDQPVAAPTMLHGARVALDMKTLPPAHARNALRPGDGIPVTLRISTAAAPPLSSTDHSSP